MLHYQFVQEAGIEEELPLFGIKGLVLAFLLSFVLCWPIWITGAHFVFSDSASYVSAGRAIWEVLYDTALKVLPSSETADTAAQDTATSFVVDDEGPKFGRSIFYSSVAYPLVALGGPSALPIFHGTFTLFAFFALMTRETLTRPVVLFGGFVYCAAVSTLPWHTAYMMPDILSATMVIFAAVLVSTFPQMTLLQKVIITAMAAFAAGAHYGNMPLAGGLAIVVVVLALLFRRLTLGVLVAALVMAATPPAVNLLASRMILETPSAAPLRLPILLARFLEDGTALRFLQEHCPEAGYAMCTAFGDEYPDGIDALLWEEGGISSLDPETMQRIREEEIPLLKEVFLTYPLQQTWMLVLNTYDQLTGSGTDQITAVNWTASDCTPETCRDEETQTLIRRFDSVTPPATYGAAIVLAILFLTGYVPRPLRLPVLVLIAGLIGNAMVFGGLSSPADRYQARLVWLVPAFLTIVLASFPRGRQSGKRVAV